MKNIETLERPGIIAQYPMQSGEIFQGHLVGVNEDGLLVPLHRETPNLKFVGVASIRAQNFYEPGKNNCTVTKDGSFVYPGSLETITRKHLGCCAYAFDSETICIRTDYLENAYCIGTIVEICETPSGILGARIRINNHTV